MFEKKVKYLVKTKVVYNYQLLKLKFKKNQCYSYIMFHVLQQLSVNTQELLVIFF